MSKLIDETGNKITVREEGYRHMRPEETGLNQLKNGSARDAFMFWLDNWSDIQEHLLYLFHNAEGTILELGTRGGVSTSALLAGIECHKKGHVYSVDFDPTCWTAFDGHPAWSFVGADSLDFHSIAKAFPNEKPELDLLFIDTEHVYSRLKKELELWAPHVKPGGKILMHDVLAFPEMAKAAQEYAEKNHLIYEVKPGSNGLGIIHAPLFKVVA